MVRSGMFKFCSWLFLLWVGIISVCFAADGINVRVSPRYGSTNDTFTQVVTVSGDTAVRTIELSQSADFDVVGKSTQQETRIENGAVSSSISYRFELRAVRAGNLTTPAVKVYLKNGTTQRFQGEMISVSKGPTAQEEAQLGELKITQSVSDLEVYEGEQLFHSIEIIARARYSNPVLTQPDYSSFWVHNLEDEEPRPRRTSDGKPYYVYHSNRVLFPTVADTLSLNEAKLSADILRQERSSSRDPFSFGGFGAFGSVFSKVRRVPVELASEPLEIEVKPLPPLPSDFNGWDLPSVIVGDTSLSVRYDSAPVSTGEGRTVTYILRSKGNINAVKTIPFPESESFNVYPETPQTKTFVQGNQLTTEKTFSFTVVPLDPGTIRVPAVTLGYFDPATERYSSTEAQSLPIVVTGNSLRQPEDSATSERETPVVTAPTPSQSEKVETEQPAQKAYDDSIPFFTRMLRFASPSGWALIVAIILLLLFLGALAFNRNKTMRPLRRAKSAIYEASSNSELLSSTLELLSVKFGTPPSPTRSQLVTAMNDSGVDEPLRFAVERVLDTLEASCYGSPETVPTFESLRQQTLDTVKEL